MSRGRLEKHDAPFGAQGADGVLDEVGVLHRLIDEGLHRGLAERTEHVAAEAAHEAFSPGETDAVDLIGLAGQHLDPGLGQHADDFLRLAALVLVIAEHADHGDAAGAQILQQVLHLDRLAEIDQVAAQAQHVRVFMHPVEQVAIGAMRGLADMQVADGGDAQLLLRSGFHARLRRLAVSGGGGRFRRR
ncbi:hypothetical protein LTR94_025016, partial [Friedmanniomyces endolithicus]